MKIFTKKFKAMKLASVGVILTMLAGCASNPLLGQWRYNDESGTSIGLALNKESECTLSLSRFLGKNSEKGCRYSINEARPITDPQAPKKYLLYLKDDAGKCDVFADFEFEHDVGAGILTFLVGETPFVMQKQVGKK